MIGQNPSFIGLSRKTPSEKGVRGCGGVDGVAGKAEKGGRQAIECITNEIFIFFYYLLIA